MLYRFILLLFSFLFFTHSAIASPLENRIQQYPQWNSKPPVKTARGDLKYPQWMAGTWKAQSTLIEQIAPLAPEIMTPGFNDNKQYINKPINFLVRFGTEYFKPQKNLFSNLFNNNQQKPIVADRVFNGEHIAAAYLGEKNVLKVKVDPDNPNQQITFLKGDRKLISRVTGRASETLTPNHFITTELTNQFFRSPERIYLNEVETTSSYQLIKPREVEAEQITAIYLSPQDPDYFKAGDRPVAIYRYQLSLQSEIKGRNNS